MNAWIFFRYTSLALGLLPFFYLTCVTIFDLVRGNVIEILTHESGQWSLFFLLLTLSVRLMSEQMPLLELRAMRRQWGLFSAFYAMLHVAIYVVLDFNFDWTGIYYDVIENIYIIFGLVAVVCLLLLSLTSTRGWQRRLKRTWKKLHRLVYVIACAALLHFFLLVKADLLEPILYALMIGFLLLYRLKTFVDKRKKFN